MTEVMSVATEASSRVVERDRNTKSMYIAAEVLAKVVSMATESRPRPRSGNASGHPFPRSLQSKLYKNPKTKIILDASRMTDALRLSATEYSILCISTPGYPPC